MNTKWKRWTDETLALTKHAIRRDEIEKRPGDPSNKYAQALWMVADTTEQPRKRCYETRSRDLIEAE